MLDLRSAEPKQAHRHTDQSRESNRPFSSATRRKAASWLVLVTVLGLSVLRAHPVLADTVVSSTATVTSSDGLNLRGGPGTSFAVLAVMPAGAVVTISGNGTPDNWLPVQYNGQVGWADGDYLSVTAGTPVPPVAPVAMSATVQPSDGLNLRSGPGSNFGVLVVLAGGSSVTVTGAAQNNWDPVSVNGSSGWVNATYVSASGSSSQAAPTITANSSGSTSGASVTASAGTSAGTTVTVPASTGTGAGVSLAWPNDSRKITTVFSPAHLGIDIDQFPNGSKLAVGAAAAGTVTFAGGASCCSYGLYVVVDHGNGLSTFYAHFSSLSVQKGQAVTQGQKLGLTGCTGTCTGDHVHFEVHVNNTPVDPLRYLPGPWVIE